MDIEHSGEVDRKFARWQLVTSETMRMVVCSVWAKAQNPKQGQASFDFWARNIRNNEALPFVFVRLNNFGSVFSFSTFVWYIL